MPGTNAKVVQRHRARQRSSGLRSVQMWLPDIRTRQFAAQVAHDIATLAKLSPEDEAMLDAFERIDAEELRECD